MANMYKVPRTCKCGYVTPRRDCWSSHLKRCHLHVPPDAEKDQLRERVHSLQAQLTAVTNQLAESIAHNAAIQQTLITQLAETKDELKRTKKRKDNYGVKTKGRKHRTELQRRKVAMKQNWMCANPDGTCPLSGQLQEYDVDHIVPLWNGGSEELDNLQAVCPACHRRKTADETEQRNAALQVQTISTGQ